MAIRNLQEIVNTNTFGTWIDRTNDIIDALSTCATLGGPSANNDSQLYIDSDIKTTGALYTDQLYPLDGAQNIITVGTLNQSPIFRTFKQEIFVAQGGLSDAIQFRSGETTADQTYAIGTGVDSESLVFTGYYPGDVGIDPITTTVQIKRADTRDSITGNANPGVITGTNIIIDDQILPEEIRFSNAKTATTWQTPRQIEFSTEFKTGTDEDEGPIPAGQQGHVSGILTVDGSEDLKVFLKVRDDSHRHDTRYYTKTDIDANFNNIADGDARYVLTAPPEDPAAPGVYQVSEITQGGMNLNDNSQLIFGTNWRAEAGGEAVFMSYDRLSQNFIFRQRLGNANFSVPNTINFRYVDAALDIDTTKIYFDMLNGAIFADGDITAFADSSDIRLKENINIIENAGEKVSKLQGITFNYIEKPDEPMTGLIAQQVEEVLPEAVYTSKNNDGEEYLALRYGNIVGLLVEAIKELQQEVKSLKEEK